MLHGARSSVLFVPYTAMDITKPTRLTTAVIERIAADHGSSRADTIRILKWINIVSYVALEIMAIMKDVLSIEAMATILLVFGLALLVSAIITMFVLFGLRSEINEKLA